MRHRRQQGLTMVELLIAMTLGLAVLLACGNLLAGVTRAYAMQVEAEAMDEAGRYALDAVARAVRQSAHVDWAASPTRESTLPARIAGLDARSLPRNGAGIDAALPESVSGSDVLALRFPGSGAPPGGDGGTVDCAGFPLHAGEEGWSIFYVARNAQGEAELRCKYRGNSNWSADAVAARVDGFQVLYGLDGDGDRVPDRYVNASTLATLDAGLPLSGVTPTQRAQDLNRRTHWKRVVAVKVALLLHGPRLDGSADMGASHGLFGPVHASTQAGDDPGTLLEERTLAGREGARMRKVYSATVAVPAMPE
jgi:type IV pilus assembly protein PilW